MNANSNRKSFSNIIKRVSIELISFALPGTWFPKENRENIPLPVAVLICLVSVLIFTGFILIAIAFVTS